MILSPQIIITGTGFVYENNSNQPSNFLKEEGIKIVRSPTLPYLNKEGILQRASFLLKDINIIKESSEVISMITGRPRLFMKTIRGMVILNSLGSTLSFRESAQQAISELRLKVEAKIEGAISELKGTISDYTKFQTISSLISFSKHFGENLVTLDNDEAAWALEFGLGQLDQNNKLAISETPVKEVLSKLCFSKGYDLFCFSAALQSSITMQERTKETSKGNRFETLIFCLLIHMSHHKVKISKLMQAAQKKNSMEGKSPVHSNAWMDTALNFTSIYSIPYSKTSQKDQDLKYLGEVLGGMKEEDKGKILIPGNELGPDGVCIWNGNDDKPIIVTFNCKFWGENVPAKNQTPSDPVKLVQQLRKSKDHLLELHFVFPRWTESKNSCFYGEEKVTVTQEKTVICFDQSNFTEFLKLVPLLRESFSAPEEPMNYEHAIETISKVIARNHGFKWIGELNRV